jgi:hypothetical protein
MTSNSADALQDVMLVCRNGHVITDLLRRCPERALTHCDRCGAVTIDHCATCGVELPGAIAVPGLHPVGTCKPPNYCDRCGAAFPWAHDRREVKRAPLAILEDMIGRLPAVIRQLRVRHGDRPPFRIVDERDLEDLLRAILHLQFGEIRPETRTPRYALVTRTDFLLVPERIALSIKLANSNLTAQFQEDAAYYQQERKCRTLVELIYDPESSIREPQLLQWTHSGIAEDMEFRCVVAAP